MENNTIKSRRALLITDNSAHASHARSILGKHGITITTEYESLYSTAVIKKSFKDTRNTVFIRKSFTRMVREWGAPFLIILDYRLYLGAESIHDADQRKLLRTLFISLVIMMKRNELADAMINFILITSKTDFAEALNFQKNPLALLDILRSDNGDINALIDGIRKDPAEFNRTFRIVALPDSAYETSLEKAIIALTNENSAEKPAVPPPAKEQAPQAIEEEKKEPAGMPFARIVFRSDESTAYINGVRVRADNNPSLRALAVGQFYIIGNWENRNQMEVAGKLGEFITGGIGGRQFHKNDDIVINLTDQCTIDATVISSMVMLMTKQLSEFTKKSIVVSYENGSILEKGSGYILIKQYIRHAY